MALFFTAHSSAAASVGGVKVVVLLPVSSLQRLDLGQRVVGDEARAGGGAVEVVVVHQDELAVLRLGDVDFHGVRAGLEGALERFDGVLGIVARGAAAMADDQDAAGCAQAVEAVRAARALSAGGRRRARRRAGGRGLCCIGRGVAVGSPGGRRRRARGAVGEKVAHDGPTGGQHTRLEVMSARTGLRRTAVGPLPRQPWPSALESAEN